MKAGRFLYSRTKSLNTFYIYIYQILSCKIKFSYQYLNNRNKYEFISAKQEKHKHKIPKNRHDRLQQINGCNANFCRDLRQDYNE